MKRGLAFLFVLGLAVVVGAAVGSMREILRAQLRVQGNLIATGVKALEHHQSDLQEAWSRVDRLSSDLLRAEQEGESQESLRLRDQDLREAEGKLLVEVLSCQQLRASISTARDRLTELRAELRKYQGESSGKRDPLSGKWKIVIDPGGQEGTMVLDLDGTLVSGTYQLAGGWSGSFRGTWVAGKVRLERVDAQLGFSAVLHARLSRGEPGRLEGTWEGTHLTAGMPAGGTWVATKIPEEEKPGYPEP